ncbi:MAG: NfeD family protein [Pyrinomonadaceae bacterium]
MLKASLIFALLLAASIAAAFSLRIAFLSRRKKSSGKPFRLVCHAASVVRTLAPEGAVLVDGELWRALARGEGAHVSCGESNVLVVGARGHLLLVERVD